MHHNIYHVDETPSKSSTGRLGIICPFCKNWVFNPKGISIDDKKLLQWLCVHCDAKFTSNVPFEEPGEDKESLINKIINELLSTNLQELIIVKKSENENIKEENLKTFLKIFLEDNVCNSLVKIPKDPTQPIIFKEKILRNLLEKELENIILEYKKSIQHTFSINKDELQKVLSNIR